jgi:hypothetical protein
LVWSPGSRTYLQAGHVAGVFELLEVVQETVGAFGVGIIEIEAAIHFVEMTAQRFHARDRGIFGVFPLATNSP